MGIDTGPFTNSSSVLIVNYNEANKLASTLPKWEDVRSKGYIESIHVFDNNSSDGSCHLVSKAFPSVNLISSKKNLGWGSAVNKGIFNLTEDLVFLSTPDMHITDRWCSKLLSHMSSNNDVGAATGIILNPSGKVVGRGLEMNAWFRFPPSPPSETPRAVDAGRGSGLLVRRKAFESVRGVDDDIFLQGGDINLCLKMKEDGWGVFFVPGALAWHRDSSSKKNLEYYNSRNFYVLAFRHLNKFNLPLAILYNSVYHTIIYSIMFIVGKKSYSELKDNIKGFFDGIVYPFKRYIGF